MLDAPAGFSRCMAGYSEVRFGGEHVARLQLPIGPIFAFRGNAVQLRARRL
jgi:hypothetical protein